MSHGAHHKLKSSRLQEGSSVPRDRVSDRELAIAVSLAQKRREVEAMMHFEDAVTTDGGKYKAPRPDSLARSLVGGSLR